MTKNFRDNPWFSKLSVPELKTLAKFGRKIILEKDDFLIKEGEDGNDVFLLLKGNLQVLKKIEGKDQVLASISRSGDIIGEVSLLDPEALRTASVQANEQCILISFNVDVLNALVVVKPQIVMKLVLDIAVGLTRKLTFSNKTITELMSGSKLSELKEEIEYQDEKLGDTHNIDVEKGKESPIYTLIMSCPVCKGEEFRTYQLVANSQKVTAEYISVPKYEGILNYATIDYNKYAIYTCPTCLFTSYDKHHFKYKTKFEKNGFRPPKNISAYITRMQNNQKARKDLFKEITGKTHDVQLAQKMFRYPHDEKTAILLYRLAIMCIEEFYIFFGRNLLKKSVDYKLIISKLYDDIGDKAESDLWMEEFIKGLKNIGNLGLDQETELFSYYQLAVAFMKMEKKDDALYYVNILMRLGNKDPMEKKYREMGRELYFDLKKKK